MYLDVFGHSQLSLHFVFFHIMVPPFYRNSNSTALWLIEHYSLPPKWPITFGHMTTYFDRMGGCVFLLPIVRYVESEHRSLCSMRIVVFPFLQF
jgi:hypothetical protein